MSPQRRYITKTALIAALGGFLMGFDASVVSGVVSFISVEFKLDSIQLGWAVASLAFTATFAMLAAGPLSDRLGRKPVLQIAALVFACSALWSAMAGSFEQLVLARMLGGIGVGFSLIVAPMYIAELAPASQRGRLVSFNQLNIVLGISVAFFSNYLILQLGKMDTSWTQMLQLDAMNWRWMLGVEALPALLYLVGLTQIPESPRWLAMRREPQHALAVLNRIHTPERGQSELQQIQAAIAEASHAAQVPLHELFSQSLRRVLLIGLSIAVLQQITGINAVFFYAPMIFEQTGVGTDTAFMQAVMVGVTNLVFTVLAMLMIDTVGRRPLLLAGVAGIAVCMLLLAWGFNQATYSLSLEAVAGLSAEVNTAALSGLQGIAFNTDLEFKNALAAALGADWKSHESELIAAAINVNSTLILASILGFVASFAISVGPVMWVLFSELFPNRIRALAISFVGFINSAVSFLVQLVFPWELDHLGTATTFMLYAVMAIAGWMIIARILPETRGQSLEDLEKKLITPMIRTNVTEVIT